MINKPIVLKKGDDPHCVHYWHIDNDQVGTCRRCGQVTRFFPYEVEPEHKKKARRGQAARKERKDARTKVLVG